MGETLPLFQPSFNKALQVEARPERLSADAGVLLQREALERTGLIEWLTQHLQDPRDPLRVWHPLRTLLRPGNAGPASQAAAWIPKLVEYLRTHVAHQVRVRLDAGFADAATLAALDAHGIGYIARLPRNPALERRFEPHRYRRGRPAKREREWTDEFVHQAGTWEWPRRVVMVIRERPGELFRDAFYLVTNIQGSQRFIRRHYQQRGEAEARFGEYKDVMGESLPCTHRGRATQEQAFARSQALLTLRALAYELLHVLRDSLERGTAEGWSLRRLREQVLKSAVRVLRHARQLQVILERRAASHWRALLRRLPTMQPAPG